jgi:DNA processing protein
MARTRPGTPPGVVGSPPPGQAQGEAPLPDEAHVAALARLPRVGPARLRALLDRYGPRRAWAEVAAGTIDRAVVVGPGRHDPAALVAVWRRAAATIDPAAYWQAHLDAGIGVAALGSAAFPAPLAADDDPPAVVFWSGDLDHLAGVRAAVVGTRRATRYGLDVAHELGLRLAEAGVAVVSGLALGIDGAAHAGALSADAAPPVAVVGSGLDRIYPRANAALWRRVARAGVVLSEYPLGAPAAAWQFPARNRLIAALADVVVVVESQATGGAMGTVLEAARRAVPVLAVTGPVTAASSDGTNQLLFDGCSPARDVGDVLLALGREPARTRRAAERRPRPEGDAAAVLGEVPWGPVAVETLALCTGLGLGPLALALDRLEADGWVARRGGWIERLGRPAGST